MFVTFRPSEWPPSALKGPLSFSKADGKSSQMEMLAWEFLVSVWQGHMPTWKNPLSTAWDELRSALEWSFSARDYARRQCSSVGFIAPPANLRRSCVGLGGTSVYMRGSYAGASDNLHSGDRTSVCISCFKPEMVFSESSESFRRCTVCLEHPFVGKSSVNRRGHLLSEYFSARHGYDSEVNHESTQNQMFFAWVMSRFESIPGDLLKYELILSRFPGKPLETWVDLNQYLGIRLSRELILSQFPKKPLDSWIESIQISEILLESWVDSNQLPTRKDTWVESPKRSHQIKSKQASIPCIHPRRSASLRRSHGTATKPVAKFLVSPKHIFSTSHNR